MLLLALGVFGYWHVFNLNVILFALIVTIPNFLFHLLPKFAGFLKIGKILINLCVDTP